MRTYPKLIRTYPKLRRTYPKLRRTYPKLRRPYPKLWRQLPILQSTSVTMKLRNSEALGHDMIYRDTELQSSRVTFLEIFKHFFSDIFIPFNSEQQDPVQINHNARIVKMRRTCSNAELAL